jgi:uncharacterized protein YgbK (DUF1537 family)
MSEDSTRGRIQIVVLDDDPTGIQTVHGCYLVTDWRPETLQHAFADDLPFFYILANTRAHTKEKAREIIGEAMAAVLEVNRQFGDSLMFISRSDSTLRNHFPTEIDVIAEKLEQKDGRPIDAVFLVPAFLECARITVDNIHYLVEGGRRIPTSETEFARDSLFGYSTSFLPDYIEEKTHGAVRSSAVRSISLDLLRQTSADLLSEFLSTVTDRSYVVVNIENYTDMNRFARALREQIVQGKRFIFQSAASLVKALAGIPDRPLLGREIVSGGGPGLFIVGSHVKRTTAQLSRLLDCPGIAGFEIAAELILQSGNRLLDPLLKKIGEVWSSGKTPVLYTSRTEMHFDSPEARLHAGKVISRFLADVVRRVPVNPSYIVAKGGITSHDVLVHGLGVSRVRVLGQILPGVPVIVTPDDCAFARMPYVIFPGNVGGENDLLRVWEILAADATTSQ